MKALRFLYQPVSDLGEAMRFYERVLGLEEAWRDGERSTAYWAPDRSCQIMVSVSGKPAGPMYLVDSLAAWVEAHPALPIAVEQDAAGAGSVIGFHDPDGNVFYVFDQGPTVHPASTGR
ncbi:catechol 2,3-dioxygenase-like lactoylglutathione lyase family enzyme [Agrococcus sp. UYP33]